MVRNTVDLKMDDMDRALVTLLWKGFPLSPHPYDDIAKELAIEPQEALKRVKSLIRKGYITRVGAIIDPKMIGFTSTLVAVKVPHDKLDALVDFLNDHPGVTHNYLRNNDYNLWFTLIEPRAEDITRVLERIKDDFGLEPVNLPMTKRYKIGVRLDIRRHN